MTDKTVSVPQTNPLDCDCEYTHASMSWCKSKEPSRGAVPERERLYPAKNESVPTESRPTEHELSETKDGYSCKCGWSVKMLARINGVERYALHLQDVISKGKK